MVSRLPLVAGDVRHGMVDRIAPLKKIDAWKTIHVTAHLQTEGVEDGWSDVDDGAARERLVGHNVGAKREKEAIRSAFVRSEDFRRIQCAGEQSLGQCLRLLAES